MLKWALFIHERFNPFFHLLMISLFLLAHGAVFHFVYPDSSTKLGSVVFLFIGVVFFFFKLRLYDEIKDYEIDRVHHSQRPLVRGLVSHQQLYHGIIFCVAIELISFSLLSTPGFVAMLIAVIYSLFMYKEFFIREKIRPYLTTYAVSHTVISVFLSIAIFSALSNQFPWALKNLDFYLFSINSWLLFNIFEFGRKTFLSSEEKEEINSYSKIYGQIGAILLVLIMAVGSLYVLGQMRSPSGSLFFNYVTLLITSLGTVGIFGMLLNRNPFGKVYRHFSSSYIVLVYLGIILFYGHNFLW